jgi:hypothetical protein
VILEKLWLCRSAAGQESIQIGPPALARSLAVAALLPSTPGKLCARLIPKKQSAAQWRCAADFVDQNSGQKKPSFLAL